MIVCITFYGNGCWNYLVWTNVVVDIPNRQSRVARKVDKSDGTMRYIIKSLSNYLPWTVEWFAPVCFCFLRTSCGALVCSLPNTNMPTLRTLMIKECIEQYVPLQWNSYPLDWRRWSTEDRKYVHHHAGIYNCRQQMFLVLRTFKHSQDRKNARRQQD